MGVDARSCDQDPEHVTKTAIDDEMSVPRASPLSPGARHRLIKTRRGERKFEFTVVHEAKLGLSFRALPPGALIVETVYANMCAEENGLKPGDRIIALNSQS